MARITHPRFQPGRVTDFGIEFVDGFAETDLGDNDVLRQALAQHGFDIDETVGLEEQTVAELRAELEGYGYDVKKSWRKPELIERLAQHRELNTEKVGFAVAELPDGTVIGDGESLATLPVEGTRFFDLTDDEMRDVAKAEGLDIPANATRSDMVGAFMSAGTTEE